MRRIVPSLVWFSALAGGPVFTANATAATKVSSNSCAALPAKDAVVAGNGVVDPVRISHEAEPSNPS